MPVVAGDLLEITFSHPTIGSGTLRPKAGEDSTFDTGGLRRADDANMVDGGGKVISQLNRVRWGLETTITNDMNTEEDLQKVAALAASPEEATYTISHVNGTVWRGTGAPVGDISANGNTGVITLKLAGGGELKKIA